MTASFKHLCCSLQFPLMGAEVHQELPLREPQRLKSSVSGRPVKTIIRLSQCADPSHHQSACKRPPFCHVFNDANGLNFPQYELVAQS